MPDFDFDFGAFGDPNPPGTMTGLGLQPNDPLYDWGSNQKPQDLLRLLHDREGFIQDQVARGNSPPPHNYQHDGQGNLRPIQPLGFTSTDSGPVVSDPSGGRNLTGPSDQPRARALGYSDPGGGFGEGPEAEAGKDKPGGPSLGGVGRAFIPPPITQQRAPTEVTPKPEEREYNPRPWSGTPSPQRDPRKVYVTGGTEDAGDAAILQAQQDQKKKEEALSDFAKSLQGVKVPVRPPLPAPGAVTPRGPVGLTPNVQQLLGLAGQGAMPSGQAGILARLLGKLG